jgi:serine/threonine-protein kinase
MTTQLSSPEELGPGSKVGAWCILEALEHPPWGRVFLVERDGRFGTLKVASRSASSEPVASAEDGEARLAHEVVALLRWRHHPRLPRYHESSGLGQPQGGFYLITHYVEGDDYSLLCAGPSFSAARLVDVFTELVRLAGELHQGGTYLGALPARHIRIRDKNGLPVLTDMSGVYLPGAAPPAAEPTQEELCRLPPEALAFLGSEAGQRGERFAWNASADWNVLGVLLYMALTGHRPYSPELPREKLLEAVETGLARAPHHLNPKAPRALSELALWLMAKWPEDRPTRPEEVLQALWEAAKERKAEAWQESLELAEGGPAEVTQEELRELRARREALEQGTARRKSASEPAPPTATLVESSPSPQGPPPPARRRWRVVIAVVGLTVLALWAGSVRLRRSTSEGDDSMSRLQESSTSTRPGGAPVLAGLLCITLKVGCATWPPPPKKGGQCPQEALENMVRLKIYPESGLTVTLDIHQPGDWGDRGVYRDGPIISQVSQGWGDMPSGALLRGKMWVADVYDYSTMPHKSVMARYTEAQLPDGRVLPVCLVLGSGSVGREWELEGSQPGAAVLQRRQNVSAVRWWP